MIVCVCMYVCAYVHAYDVRICMSCEHMCLLICICGGADLAWMMGLESWCLSGLQSVRDGAC